MRKIFLWVLAAILTLSGASVFTSCSSDDNPVKPIIPAKDLLYQWIVDYDVDDIEGNGITVDHAVKVYEFFADGTGYYEYYLLNEGGLEFVEYLRGFNGEFTYTVSNNMVTIKLLDEFDELEPIWKLTFTDGRLIDPDDRVFRQSTDIERFQILEWYAMWTDNPTPPDINVAEKIIGKWMVADRDGQHLLTNEKVVLNFVSATKVKVSASVSNDPEMGELWVDKVDNDVDISGNKITVTGHPDAHTTVVEEYFVTDINTNEFMANFKATRTVDGTVVTSTEDAILRFVKVTEDYTEAVVGLWQITFTSDNPEDESSEPYRELYRKDGTCSFYDLIDGQWVEEETTYCEYFSDGPLFCFRWQKPGEERRHENWEIVSCGNGEMVSKSLHRRADGSIYTIIAHLTKVE